LLLLASGLLYVITFLRRHAEDIQGRLAGGGYRRGWSRRRAAGIAASDDDRPTDAAEQEAGLNGLNPGRLAGAMTVEPLLSTKLHAPGGPAETWSRARAWPPGSRRGCGSPAV